MVIGVSDAASCVYHFPLIIRHLLTAPRASAAHQQIVYRDLRRHDYTEFYRRICRLARALRRVGVESGTTVAVMDWDSHRYLEGYFAVPMLGAVLQTVNIRLAPEQIKYTLNHAAAEVLIVHRDFLPVLTPIRSELTSLRVCILAEDVLGLPSPVGFAGEYEALLAREESDYAFPDFDENTVATTFYTTGTTGQPKGVSFTHRQLVLHTLATLAALASTTFAPCFRRDDVYMPLTPMFHVHAWGLPYVATLLGVKQVYPGRYDPDFLLALKQREGVTYSHCVPTILDMLLTAPSAAVTDCRGWKFTVGGAAMPTTLAKRALERGMEVAAGYGMSETGPVVNLSRVECGAGDNVHADLATRCKQGVAIPLVEQRIVDETMQDVPRDGVHQGELVMRAPWLTAGYRGDRAASEHLWRGGWLHTGDIATIDPEGYMVIRDRLKDVIKSGGEWISSLQIEELILRHSGVAEAAVVAIQDERWGERPLAIVVPKEGLTTTQLATELIGHVAAFADAGVIPKYGVPVRVHIVEALDKTSVGKLDKKRLRARLGL